MKKHQYLLAALCLFLPIFLYGQKAVDYPRDTSFSVWSSYKKLKKDHPFIVPVSEFKEGKINSERDLVYGSTSTRDLHLDIFWPIEVQLKKSPGVICIHGGGWASGNKSHLLPLAQKLADQGYFACTIEYRLSPEAKYPAGIYDIKSAIKWVKAHAAEYNLDSSKIAVLGASAGATLASLVGATGNLPLFEPPGSSSKISTRVQAIVNIDGILDFTDPAESGKDLHPSKPSAAARWFGSTYTEYPAAWIEASPLTYVSAETPPTVFINSAIPRFHAGRDSYLAVLKKNGTPWEVHTLDGSPHAFWLFDPWFEESIQYITLFLDKVF